MWEVSESVQRKHEQDDNMSKIESFTKIFICNHDHQQENSNFSTFTSSLLIFVLFLLRTKQNNQPIYLKWYRHEDACDKRVGEVAREHQLNLRQQQQQQGGEHLPELITRLGDLDRKNRISLACRLEKLVADIFHDRKSKLFGPDDSGSSDEEG